MQDSPRGVRAIILAAIVLCIVASMSGAKGQGKDAGLKIGLVNVSRAMNEYKFITGFRADMMKKQTDLETLRRTLESNPLLGEKEQEELCQLAILENTTGGPGMSDAQKNRKKQLLDQSKTMNDDLAALAAKPTGALNPQDVARLNNYTKSRSDTETRFNTKQAQVAADLKTQDANSAMKVEKDMKDAISKIAKEKNINLVFSNDVVLYAETDLTDDVIKAINK